MSVKLSSSLNTHIVNRTNNSINNNETIDQSEINNIKPYANIPAFVYKNYVPSFMGYPSQSKFKWNYLFLTQSDNLVFCGTNWTLNAYKLNQDFVNKNIKSKDWRVCVKNFN